ncbi:MAG TPA: ATP-grasp domain-containing protein [Pseudonocardia sp.]|nr:ATP-grasp domain-containing protein [Pseudonocardia sp.]
MVLNVFVLGLDDHNAHILARLPEAEQYRFHPLLTVAELLEADRISVPELLDSAERALRDFDGPVHALIGFWDFPVSTMLPLLTRRLGLRWSSLESVLKCEHKYWSRLEQQRVIDEYPRFGLLHLDDPAVLPDGLRYPVWIKPVKSASSTLAFRVTDHEQLATAVDEIRAGIGRIGEPFEFLLDQVTLPPGLRRAGGHACLIEEAVTGVQVTVEGYTVGGDVRVYGVVDSITCPDSPSFLRYQYPSTLPPAVTDRMAELSRRVVRQVGLDGITFNIEYFWDPQRDAVALLEINPRHSQSHAELFERVDGVPNHDHMLQLALGREPRPTQREGHSALAAKWFVRRRGDGVVRRVPTPAEIERVEREVHGCTVDLVVKVGDRLSTLANQDSFSYELAHVYVGGDDEDQLRRDYERAVDELPFEFDEPS